jgi:hypothetical protein
MHAMQFGGAAHYLARKALPGVAETKTGVPGEERKIFSLFFPVWGLSGSL